MFELPDLSTLDESGLKDLLKTAMDEHARLAKIDDDKISDDEITELENATAAVQAIKSAQANIGKVDEERKARIAAAKAGADAAPAEEPAPAEDPALVEDPALAAAAVEPVVEPTIDPAPIDPIADPIQEEETIVASAVPTGIAAAAAAATAPAADAEPVSKLRELAPIAITASAGVRGYEVGQEIADLTGLGAAFSAVATKFQKPRPGSQSITQAFSVATIARPIDPDFALTGDPEHDHDTLMAASRESRLEGGSLVAAGGWCAPSETLYDMCVWETIDGILSVPEVTWNRGGIQFTKGPDFSTIYDGTDASFGFVQTETQAEAGEEKKFETIECPDWEEARLEAVGYGIRAGILTQVTYPELLRRYTEGALVAHAHKMNKRVIGKIVTELGTAVTARALGSAVADTLAALEAAVMRLRYKFRLNANATVEGFAPLWLMSVLRADLAFRNGGGLDHINVTDGQVKAWLASRGVNLQFVYDWQDLATSGASLTIPGSVDIALYPSGTFVKGVNNVISLDAVYDYDSLKTNTYTAMFFEEAMQIANVCGEGLLLRVGLESAGRTGAANITRATGLTAVTA